MLQKFWRIDNWSKLAIISLWSYVFIGKAAVYLGLLVGVFLLFSAKVLWDRWFVALSGHRNPLGPLSWALLVSLVYGIAQTIRGTLIGYPPLIALEILVFNLCPAYLFLGIWVGMRHPGVNRKYIRFLAWWTVIYAPMYFLFFKNMKLSLTGLLPGTGLDLLSDPGSGTMALMGLLSLETSLAQFWIPIVVLVCLTIGYQERGDWLGFGFAVLVWAKLTNKITRFFMFAGFIVAVLVIASLIDLKLPPLPGRGGELSARGTVARLAGSISPEMATEVGADVATARFDYGTVYWRKHWWARIRGEVFRDKKSVIFGLGYGYPLAKLASRDVEKQGTRSPHSIFYFTLAYSGILGFLIFCWLAICMVQLLWRNYKVSGETFGLMIYLYTLLGAFVGNLIETPQAAIPLYLLCGISLAPLFRPAEPVYEEEFPMPEGVAELV